MSDGDLFRAQALRPKQPTWIGGITVRSDKVWWVYSLIGIGGAAVFLLLIVFGSYTRRITVEGILTPSSGVAIVASTMPGVVSEVRYETSNSVRSGDILAAIASGAYSPTVGDTSLAVAEGLKQREMHAKSSHDARLAISKVKQRAARARIQSLEVELRNIAAEIDERRKQVELSRAVAERYQQISGEGYVSFVQLQQQENQVLEANNALRVTQRKEITLRRELMDVAVSIRELLEEERSIEAELGSLSASIEVERIRNLQASETELRAPFDGFVGNVYVKTGQSVSAGEPIFSIVGSGSPLHGEIYLASAVVASVKPGDTVIISYDAFPYQRFGHHKGLISSISDVAMVDRSISGGAPVYKAYFEIESQNVVSANAVKEPLRAGMTFTAYIQGERRKLYEWLLEPLHSGPNPNSRPTDERKEPLHSARS